MSYSIRTVTVSAFRIFIALKPNPCLLTSSLNSCFKTHTAQLHNSSPFATRFRNHRRANGSQQRTTGKALLDKFVKHLSLDGAFVVRAPFALEIRGSHFDSDNKVDKYRNSAMTRLYNKQHDEEPVLKISSIDSGTASSDKISEENIKERAQEYAKQTNKLIQSDIDREERIKLKDQEKTQSFSDDFDEEEDAILDETQSPLHILLYGRSNHRVDSYSVVNEQHQQHTYVYVLDSDAPPLELDTIKDHYHKTSVKEDSYNATAHMSLWEPRLPTDNSSELGTLPGPRGETFSSSLRFYSFKDILESYDAAIKGVCLVPTQMNKIYCQCEVGGRIQLDGTLIEGLEMVGLNTELGSITVKDVTADEILLTSRSGDIDMDGIIDGDTINAETDGDGDVVITGKGIFGDNLTVSTQYGDIFVDAECRNDSVNLTTDEGSIQAQKMFNKSCSFNILEKGDVSAKVNVGQIDVAVRRGTVDLFVESITTDSTILLTSGKVNLTIPLKSSFKVWLSAPMTNIAPQLQNSGELILSRDNGNEEFSTENTAKNGQVPILRVRVDQGSIQVNVAEKDEDKAVRLGFDSATETS